MFEILIDFEMLCVIHHTQLWISQALLPLSRRYAPTTRLVVCAEEIAAVVPVARTGQFCVARTFITM